MFSDHYLDDEDSICKSLLQCHPLLFWVVLGVSIILALIHLYIQYIHCECELLQK